MCYCVCNSASVCACTSVSQHRVGSGQSCLVCAPERQSSVQIDIFGLPCCSPGPVETAARPLSDNASELVMKAICSSLLSHTHTHKNTHTHTDTHTHTHSHCSVRYPPARTLYR